MSPLTPDRRSNLPARLPNPARGPRLPRLLVGGVAAIALGLSSCSSGTPAPSPSSSAPPPVTSAPPSAPAPSGAAPSASGPGTSSPAPERDATDIREAIGIALDEVDGDVVDVELSSRGEQQVWQVDVRRSARQVAELLIDTADGRVVSNRKESEVADEARAAAPDFTALRAVAAAERRVSGGQAVSLDLGDEGAARTWELEIRRTGSPPVEVTLDADSGAFLRQATDD